MCLLCSASVQPYGSEDIDFANHPLLSALATSAPGQSSYTYYFAPAGDAVNKGGYSGGDDVTRAWSVAEQAAFVAVTQRYAQVADITFNETGTLGEADFNLQIVDDVPGGWAGYAGGRTFVVGNASTGLITHELGHSLGLDHPFAGGASLPGVTGAYEAGAFGFNSEFYTVMAYNRGAYDEYPDLSLPGPQSLGTLDIAALQAIYGANESFANGDDTYGIPAGISAIWDGGGRDAIDFSAALTDAVIDLRAATLEVAAGGLGRPSIADVEDGDSGAYTIAYGVTIEDGHGGAGRDRITGNAAANSLTGGLGDDTLSGGAGDDHLTGSAANGALIETVAMVEMDSDSALRREGYAMPGSVTIDMVLRLDPAVTHDQRLISYAPVSSADVGLELQLWNTDYPYLYVITRSGSTLSTLSTGISRSELADGDIHRLTLSRDAATGQIRLYLDGVYQGGGTNRPGEGLPPGGDLVFGQSQGVWGGADNPAYAFEGAFGPIAVYDGVLSDGAIAARSIADLADTGHPDLVSYWTPEAGASFADATGGAALSADQTGAVSDAALNSDNDLIAGEAGADTLLGGVGDDTLLGGSGADSLFGGPGDDIYRATLSEAAGDVISEAGGGGTDRLELTDAMARDLGFARDGDDLLVGTGGLWIAGHFAGARVEALPDAGPLYALHSGSVGGGGADILVAPASGAAISGGAGDDLLFGGTGADVLDGGAGDDRMAGGLGNDFYIIDSAGDEITGEIAFSLGGGIDTIRAFIDYTQPENIELLRLGNLTDTTPLSGTGNDAPGTIVGNAAGNTLVGRGGNDQLNGNGGDDVITGNTGRDTLVGGEGADSFIYLAYADSRAGSAARDVINGFSLGVDRIDLAALDADTTSFGLDDAFAFIGSARFSGQAGELRLQGLGGANAVLVEGDHNGDAEADFQIFVNLTTWMTSSDFIL